MKRTIGIVGALAAIAVIGWWAYGAYFAPPPEPTAEELAAATEAEDLANVIWASGKLTPRRWADLSTSYSGTVAQIYVEEGDWVEEGALLVELDNAVLQSEAQMAAAQVAEAQAALDKLIAGATDAEIAGARAQVAAAEALVAQAAGQMLETQSAIDLAETQVVIAEREYAELAGHPTAAELQAAEAEASIAQAGVNQAQAAYNLVRGDPNIAALPQAMALQQATASLEAANAKLNLVTQGATPQQLAVAQGAIDAAREQVEAARSHAPAAEATVESAMAGLAGAQAALDRLLAGATQEEVAMGEAQLQSAQAALASAQARLDFTRIDAPFAGQIGTVNLRPGEMATPGQIAVRMGDTREMHVETTDLRETDVVRLDKGMTVEVTFDALPDRVFVGAIAQIAPVSSTEQGSTNYTVEIDVMDLDDSLRWGMTAFVNIAAPR